MKPLPTSPRPPSDTAQAMRLNRRCSPLLPDNPLDKKHGSWLVTWKQQQSAALSCSREATAAQHGEEDGAFDVEFEAGEARVQRRTSRRPESVVD